MPYFLKVLSSPEKKLDGLKLELLEGETLVGRVSPPAQIKLEGTKVSKKHCVFLLNGMALKVDDLKSSNGLYVNGKRIESAQLKEKDRIVIGEYVLEVTLGASEPKPPPIPGAPPAKEKTNAAAVSEKDKDKGKT